MCPWGGGGKRKEESGRRILLGDNLGGFVVTDRVQLCWSFDFR